jgi:hypothetical protein
MIASETGPRPPVGDWWSGLVFPLSFIAAMLNGMVLFFGATWSSVPEHHGIPDGQPLPTAEAAAQAGLPFWGLLVIVIASAVASFVAELRGRSRAALWFGAVQLLPAGVLIASILFSAVF